MRWHFSLIAAAGLAGVVLLAAPPAEACGGCFAPQPPPGEPVSIVTDHKMILSISQSQSTLYDQIEYSGDPASFAWVLPIVGTVDVGLSSDTVFSTLSTVTTSSVIAPPTGCPAPTNCAYDEGLGASVSADAGAAGGVDVLKRETVGPYDTVQLRSTDPNALTAWLTDNGFTIPDATKPVIAAYVTEHFDFLALKLVPGKGVGAMRPVRVTTQGANPVLPLRMVAAGTGATVGITLWVLGEGRYDRARSRT